MSFLSRASQPITFPTYLLPSLSFARRKSRAASSCASSPDSPFGTPISPISEDPDKYLNGHTSYLRCATCAANLCLTSQIISKGFTGRHGRAYLVSSAPTSSAASEIPFLSNTVTGKPVPRQLVTGAHTVSDLKCAFCKELLGWKYVAAEEEAQRYKVGKFILETKKICQSTCWEEVHSEGRVFGTEATEIEDVEFDSQDEDECEDLFAGAWTPSLARKRRQGKRWGREL